MISRSDKASLRHRKSDSKTSSQLSGRYYNLYLRQKWSDGKFSIKGDIFRRLSRHNYGLSRTDSQTGSAKVSSLRNISKPPEKQFGLQIASLRSIEDLSPQKGEKQRKQEKQVNCFDIVEKADESALDIMTVDFNREFCNDHTGSYKDSNNSTLEDNEEENSKEKPQRKPIYFLNRSETSECDSDYVEI